MTKRNNFNAGTRSYLALGAVVVTLAAGGAAGAHADTAALGANDPCVLLAAADAQRIGGIPMKGSSANHGKSCVYQRAKPGKGENIHVGLEILSAEEWSFAKSGLLGKVETDGMKGLGDEEYFTRTKGKSGSFDHLTFFVRKGTVSFSLMLSDLGTEPTGVMKDVMRKIAATIGR